MREPFYLFRPIFRVSATSWIIAVIAVLVLTGILGWIAYSAWRYWGTSGAPAVMIELSKVDPLRSYEDSENFVGPKSNRVNANNLEQLGQAGDAFGGFNALVGAATVVLLVLAALLQIMTLHATRQISKRQQFEDHFFRLLQLAKEASAEVDWASSKQKVNAEKFMKTGSMALSTETHRKEKKGIAALKAYGAAVRNKATDIKVPENEIPPWIKDQPNAKLLWQLVQSYLDNAYNQSPSTFGPMMRILFHLFQFVRSAPGVGDRERSHFTKLAIATLDEATVFLLALNGLTPKGKKFKLLIEEMGLIEHLNHTYKLKYEGALALEYAKSAFGSRHAAFDPGHTPETDEFKLDFSQAR